MFSIGSVFLDVKMNEKPLMQGLSGLTNLLPPKLGMVAKLAGAAFGSKLAYEMGKQAINIASDLTEVQNVVDVTFKAMSQDIDDFANTSMKAYGLSELAAKQYTSTMGAMLKSSGFSIRQAKDMSVEMAKLSADMASFYNLSNEEAFNKIRAGLIGQTVPLQQLGINMNIANLEAYALSQGIKTSWQEMSQSEQIMLRYNYLLKATADSQGDFTRNSETWANQTKILSEQWKEFLGILGSGLIEILLPLVRAMNKLLEVVINIMRKIGDAYNFIMGKQIQESNLAVIDSSYDVAEGQEEMASGIGKAAKAAAKAVAPFDELNLLQEQLSSGGGGSGGLKDLAINMGESTSNGLNEMMNKIKETEDEVDKFATGLYDRLQRAFQEAPVPAPIKIPEVDYSQFRSSLKKAREYLGELNTSPEPLIIPPAERSLFEESLRESQRLKNAIENSMREWQPATIPPAITNAYEESLREAQKLANEVARSIQSSLSEGAKGTSAEVSKEMQTMGKNVKDELGKLKLDSVGIWDMVSKDTNAKAEAIKNATAGSYSQMTETIEKNLAEHGKSVIDTTNRTAQTRHANLQSELGTEVTNRNIANKTNEENANKFANGMVNIAQELAKTRLANINEGLRVEQGNYIEAYQGIHANYIKAGEGMLRISADASKNRVENEVNANRTIWQSFTDLVRAMGERISSTWKENKAFRVATTLAVGGLALGAAAALAGPAVIAFAGKAAAAAATYGGMALSFSGAHAKGAITRGPSLGIIGDNPGGREVITPLDNLNKMITDSVVTAVQMLLDTQGEYSGLGRSNMNENTAREVALNIEGRQFARLILPYLMEEFDRMGVQLARV